MVRRHDSPHGNGYYGGTVAAPIFKRIAEQSLRQLGIGPTINPAPRVLVAPVRALVQRLGPHVEDVSPVVIRPGEQRDRDEPQLEPPNPHRRECIGRGP